jgi:APA family basic amino acid/polyamine antiporter
MKTASTGPAKKEALLGIERKLSLPICVALVIGNMLGSGIFILPGSLAQFGGLSLLAWICSAVGAIALAAVLASLQRKAREPGDLWFCLRHSCGNTIGGAGAWSYWLSVVIGNAAVAVALGSYIVYFIPAIRSPLNVCLIAFALIWITIGINARSTYGASRLQLTGTILTLIPLLALVLAAIPHLSLDHLQEQASAGPFSLITLGRLTALVFWAFIGLESANATANIIENPKDTIPRAILAGTLIVSLLYIAIVTVTLGTVSASVLTASPYPLTEVAARVMGPFGNKIIATGGIVAMFTALNGFTLIAGQLGRSMAQHKIFFPSVAGESSPEAPPRRALVLAGILSSAVIALVSQPITMHGFHFVCALATGAMLLPYSLACLAEPILILRRRPRPPRSLLKVGFNLVVIALLYWGSFCAYRALLPWIAGVAVCSILATLFFRYVNKRHQSTSPRS